MATTAQYTSQPLVEGSTTATTASTTIAAALARTAAAGVGKRIIRVYSTIPTTNTAGKLS